VSVFATYHSRHCNYLIQSGSVPIVDVLLLVAEECKFFGWVIYERTERVFVALPHRHSKYVVNLAPDDAGSVFQDMGERRNLAVEVAEEVFSAFWQVENRL